MDPAVTLRRVRAWLTVLVVGLVLSGVTAFPLQHETAWLDRWLHTGPLARIVADHAQFGLEWIDRVTAGIAATDRAYPFLAYGTDWLAFAHIMIAVLFVGAVRDPVRNRWVVQFGILACVGIVPLALICGPIRGIPFWWSLIDMSFGVVGVIPLLFALRGIRALERTGHPDQVPIRT